MPKILKTINLKNPSNEVFNVYITSSIGQKIWLLDGINDSNWNRSLQLMVPDVYFLTVLLKGALVTKKIIVVE